MAFGESKGAALGFALGTTVLLVMYLVGFCIPYWSMTTNVSSFESTRMSHFGLWKACGVSHDMIIDEFLPSDECFSTLEQGVPGWLRAVQLFAVLVVVFGLASWVMLWWITCGYFGEEKAFQFMLPCWILAGICMLVAMCIFGHFVKPKLDTFEIPGRVQLEEERIEFAWGFILVAVTTAIWNAFSIVFICITCCC
ncbi:hypothetical protein SNE40_002114 [Patella caerulea]|uniref:Uncharacterized protein n=1 Tax=Patella caerulea TaxID=87958 RepID=A0AAN8K0I2_PATCE